MWCILFCCRLKNIPQLPSGKSDVINGFELLAHGLRRLCELSALFGSDTLNFCQASVLQYAMKPSQQDDVIVSNMYFSVLDREFIFRILMQIWNVIFFPFKCLSTNYFLALHMREEKKKRKQVMNHWAVDLPVCFESEVRRMYKAKTASYLFCILFECPCLVLLEWWNRSRQGPF